MCFGSWTQCHLLSSTHITKGKNEWAVFYYLWNKQTNVVYSHLSGNKMLHGIFSVNGAVLEIHIFESNWEKYKSITRLCSMLTILFVKMILNYYLFFQKQNKNRKWKWLSGHDEGRNTAEKQCGQFQVSMEDLFDHYLTFEVYMHKGLENIPRCQLESRCKPNPVWIDGWTTIPTGYYITLLSILVNKLWCGWRSLQSCSLSLGTCLLFVQLINLRIISVESHLHQMEHHDSQSYQVHKIVSLFVPSNYCQRLILYNHHLTMTTSTATCSHHASALFIYLCNKTCIPDTMHWFLFFNLYILVYPYRKGMHFEFRLL